jgi:uncharacterized protein (DUF362 family)
LFQHDAAHSQAAGLRLDCRYFYHREDLAMSDLLDRRTFLKHLLALGAAGATLELSGCGQATREKAPAATAAQGSTTAASPTAAPAARPTAGQAALPAATAVPAEPATAVPAPPTATAPAAEPTVAPVAVAAPAMAVARGPEASPAEITRRAIAAIGGMERFVKKGADVIVKPNICVAYWGPEYAATSNPEVVATIVSLCLAAGAKRVRVMDLPFGGEPRDAYEKSGIGKAVTEAGGTMEIMSRVKYKDTPIPQGKSIKKWPIYQDVLNADVLINVPIPKHHSLAGLTLGMKNVLGVVSGNNRGALHSNINQRLADLATVVRPTLTIVDAIRILTANGPSGGNLNDVRKLDTIIATTDPVAADAYACTLFGKGKTVGYVDTAAAMGLGEKDLSKLRIEEIAL